MADALAKVTGKSTGMQLPPTESSLSVCTFRVGGALYGMEVLSLREVSRIPPITPLPQAPAAVRGLANLRSSIFLVLDLRAMLSLPVVKATADSRLIVLKTSVAENVAILVDSGGDVRKVERNRLELRSDLLEQTRGGDPAPKHDLVVGTARLEEELLMLIDPKSYEVTLEKLVR